MGVAQVNTLKSLLSPVLLGLDFLSLLSCLEDPRLSFSADLLEGGCSYSEHWLNIQRRTLAWDNQAQVQTLHALFCAQGIKAEM